MASLLTYNAFLNERYYSKNHNLYKVLNSKEPIISEPIFHEDEMKSVYAVRRKIREDLAGYIKHVEDVEKKDAEWRKAASGKRGEKGNLTWYDTAKKTREFALKVVKDSADFMEKFNSLYDTVKDDLLSSNHVKVAEAIVKMQDIYPTDLISEAGKLKRLKKMKIDSQFITDVLKWTESIRKIYDNMEEAGKMLGKTEKQILGARKQSAAQRMRWGMY